LLRVTTDLYVQKPTHSADEDRHFTELALRLFDLVDARTRAIVAEKIAGYANAPTAVRHRALRDRIAASHLPTDASSVRAPSAAGAAVAAELTELFFAASAEERRLILANLPYAALAPAQPMAATLARAAVDRLEVAALGHYGESFARELERALGVSPALARRIRDDASGEPVVVAAVALGMPAFVLQRVLLCLHASISQSVQRVYDLALLYEELAPKAALQLLAIWRASHAAQHRKPPPIASNDAPRHILPPAQPVTAPLARRIVVAARSEISWDEHAKSRKDTA
jgi:hypothetical protein